MKGSERYRLIVTTISLMSFVSLVFGGIIPPSFAHQKDQDLYESGKNCQSQLFATPQKRKFRIYWERCILPFERLYTRYPNSPRADDALFYAGGLYKGLYGYSGKPKDLAKAKSSYVELLKKYPKSALVPKAESRLAALNPAPKVVVENIRHWAYHDYTRLVLDLNRAFQYRKDQLGNPSAITIRLPNAKLGKKAKTEIPSLNTGLLKWVEVRSSPANTVEVSISLNGSIHNPKIVPLSNPDRLVIDLFRKSSDSPAGTPAALPPPFSIRTIVIDPGHGGKDPGAIGKKGLQEKEVVLDIGLRLRDLITKRLGKKVIMTRKNDTFISLDERTLMANSAKADLFISIHANAHPKHSTRGVEIYLLGHSTDQRALAVAARENSVSLESAGRLNNTIKNILLDLGMDYKINESLEFAHSTKRSFMTTLKNRYRYNIADLRVKQAPFYVLLNSNMPSILAEVSYISNPEEEQLLRKALYRQAVAESLFDGIREYIASFTSTS